MKTIHIGLFGLLFIFLASLSAEATPFTDTTADGISYTYEGSGCPTSGSVQVVLAPDRSSFTILYNSMDLRVGGNTGQGTDAIACDVKFNLQGISRIYKVDFASADFRGFASLDAGVFGTNEVTAKIDSAPTIGFNVRGFQGPQQGNYLLSAQPVNILSALPFPGAISKFLQCAANRNNPEIYVKTRLKITNATPQRLGMLTVDSADGRLAQTFRLSIKRCF